jgi:TonB family protein
MIEINSISRIAIRQLAAALFLAAISSLVVSAPEPGVHVVVGERGTEPPGRHVTRDLNGVLTTGENLTLKLNTDLGSLRIVPLQPGAPPVVRYSVHLETDARGEAAAQLLDRYAFNAKSTPAGAVITGNLPQLSRGNGGAQFWVHYEIAVPASYSLDVTTGAGDIQTFDVGGTATLVTEGGNIVGGSIGTNFIRGQGTRGRGNVTRLVGKLQTQGGHIQVDDVAGDLTAFTAGGHINTGRIFGEANLQSGGGHIRSAAIDGRAELATEGGNITVGKAEKLVTVKTGGGQIDFGEVRGSVRAQTGGGGIRVMYVAGPMDVESSGGSICLTRVSGSVRAATDSGTITAWINPEAERHSETVNLPGASQLTSGEGDIVVFLPKNLAANIEAIVENGGARRIEADPALALQIAKVSQSSGAVKAWTTLNGGGAVLKLKTTGGKIKLQYSDSEMALWDSMMRDQSARMERELTRAALALPARPGEMAAPAAWPTPQISVAPPAPVAAKANPRPAAAPEPSDVWNGSWVERMEVRLIGGVRMDADEFWTRVTRHPDPVYPEVARKGGIEGTVRLQVRLTQDGKIEVQKLLEGDTVLADAAMAAVKQWRGKPMWTADGKPVDVVSTITFRFKLRD